MIGWSFSRTLSVTLVMSSIAGTLFAQEARFDARANLVLVPVTVTDKKGNFVDGLEATEFRLLDNGRPQKLVSDTIGTGIAPVALVIAVQSSGISTPVLGKVYKIGAMIQPLVTGERGCAAVVSFADRVEWQQECTSDADAIASSLEKIRPGAEKTAHMLDAVHAGIARLRLLPNVRRIVFMISESRDRGSESELESVLAAAQSAGVTIYAATYSAITAAFAARPEEVPSARYPDAPPPPRAEPGSPPGREHIPIPPPEQRVDLLGAFSELGRLGKTKTTEALVKGTGGTTFSFAGERGLESAIEKLGSELHSQYVLGFVPDSPAPGYHRIEVQVARSRTYRIRARPGYWAVQDAR
jgi:VWFA-related protein